MRITKPLTYPFYCNACGRDIPHGTGQRFQLNNKPDSWLCALCNEEYWQWAKGKLNREELRDISVVDVFQRIDHRT